MGEINEQYVAQIREELYQNYNERCSMNRSVGRIQKALEDWKLKAEKELSAVNVPKEELDYYDDFEY